MFVCFLCFSLGVLTHASGTLSLVQTGTSDAPLSQRAGAEPKLDSPLKSFQMIPLVVLIVEVASAYNRVYFLTDSCRQPYRPLFCWNLDEAQTGTLLWELV